MQDMEELNALSHEVIAAAIEVHRHLGPGLLESAYEECLGHELTLRGIAFERQKLMPLVYKGLIVKNAYRVDMLVENKIVVENKAASVVLEVHESQVLTYLKLGNHRLGLIFNFHAKRLKDGICRLIR